MLSSSLSCKDHYRYNMVPHCFTRCHYSPLPLLPWVALVAVCTRNCFELCQTCVLPTAQHTVQSHKPMHQPPVRWLVHGLSSVVMGYHQLSWAIISCHGLSSVVMGYHQLSHQVMFLLIGHLFHNGPEPLLETAH